MTTAEQDIDSFTQFARERLRGGGSDVSIDELFDLWRIENPSDDETSENVAAINAALDDFRNGDRGRSRRSVRGLTPSDSPRSFLSRQTLAFVQPKE